MSDALASWIDGAPARDVPVDDRGLHYGDGVFETILVRNGRARFIDLHLARLARGCERLGLPLVFTDALRAELATACDRAPPLAILKVIVTRGSQTRRGYAPQADATPRRIVSLFTTERPRIEEAGVALTLASMRVADQPALAGIKHLNRLENVLAAREAAAAGAFDALLAGADGRLVSGAMTNVFAVRENVLWTPAVDRAGVAGVMRAVVLREAAALGLAAMERDLAPADLGRVDGLFVTNARLGVVPVQRVGEHRFRMNATIHRIAAHVETLDA